ncbi:two-component sensor histidine kinase [Roseomonas sp. M0104]|uniref:histidine kinase n=1 Tax=Teichococcus coralli TaxID=2545983 RepID=A0A845BEF6_9PROT|nr:ATP-binding protein [Pseudoroseomonas coralli]MXP65501.1 two-component sensor histidine kinase [Pseudoroseomonas coralli]
MLQNGPAPGRWLASAALIGGVPFALFALLALSGQATPVPALLCMAVTAGAALLVARLWLGGLARLAAVLRRAADGEEAWPAPLFPPLLPALAEISEGVARLARSLAERGELVGRMRRADAAILESLPDPLLVLGDDRAALRANAAARALFGVRATEVGPLAGDTAAALRHPALAGAVDRALAEGTPQAVDLVLPVPVPRELAVQVIPLEPPLADGGRLIVQLSDRTRERAVERMRADFVANASHELRTPLASLMGFIETLRGPAENDPEARARFLGIMAEQSDRMRRLIDDLLGLSRIELAEHQAPTGRVPLAELARGEAEAMAPILATRSVKLVLAVDEAAVAAPADAEQLAQVLRNLLENAVRHGNAGGEVKLAVERTPGARPGVTLSVTDDGPGIPREHIPRLTERFYRVDKGRSRQAGGTGLGLAIVKHIVNRHRGQLHIESQEGTGATFRIWLPAE